MLIASGCAGDCTGFPRGAQLGQLGAVVTHSITLHARRGWPAPRFKEVPAGLLYAGGLPNPGLRVTLRDAAPAWSGLGMPVIVSIAADSLADYAELASELESVPGVVAIEVNLDWPGAGDAESHTPAVIARVTEAVATASSLPLILKLSPSEGLRDAALAAQEGGADAVTIGHGWPSAWYDAEGADCFAGRRPRLAGAAILPLTLHAISATTPELTIGVIASGGIVNADAALRCLAAGAIAVQVGSALFRNPNAAIEIATEVAARRAIAP